MTAARRPVPTCVYGGAIALATLLAYSNSFHGAFVYDDTDAIVRNTSIRSFATALSPPPATAASGRPLLNLSLAISHALSGSAPWGYHAVNVLIQLLAGLVLFGLIRRTLALLQRPSDFLAFAAALLWTIHPLQTESVDYVIQRAESLAGLFYLLTVYCFARAFGGGGAPAAHPLRWLALSWLSCALGMATKETLVTAPIIVLLYDRTFVGGCFRNAVSNRWRFHLAIAATWLELAWFVASTGGNRGGTIGFGIGVSWWSYVLTQFRAIPTYLARAFWPHPLILDYGPMSVADPTQVLGYALVVAALVGATIYALVRRPVLGFLGAWYFGILAPTSLVPGTTQFIVEHRVYLSLAALVALVVVGVGRRVPPAVSWAIAPLALALAATTYARNADYYTEYSLWAKTAAEVPSNPNAHGNLAALLLNQGDLAAADRECRLALRLEPRLPEPWVTLGNLYTKQGQLQQALAAYRHAVDLRPNYAQSHTSLGNAYEETGHIREAIQEYQTALQLSPGGVETENNLGLALSREGKEADAIAWFAAALRSDPNFAPAYYNWGTACRELRQFDEALDRYRTAIRLQPDYPQAELDLGILLLQLGRLPESQAVLGHLVGDHPDFALARNALGVVLLREGDRPSAIAQFQAAVRDDPGYGPAQKNLKAAEQPPDGPF